MELIKRAKRGGNHEIVADFILGYGLDTKHTAGITFINNEDPSPRGYDLVLNLEDIDQLQRILTRLKEKVK